MKDVWAIALFFTWILVLKSRESGERLSYYHTFSNGSGRKVEDVSTRLWILKARESEERLNYCHTFSIALGTQVWRTSQLLSYLFYCFGCSNQEKVKDVSNIIILFLMLWVLKWRESEGRLNDCHTFLLLSVLKIRENGERLSSYYTFSNAFGLQVKRKSRASQLSHTFSIALGLQVKRKWRTSQLFS